ncbi:hypothetical protein L1S32_09960 [Methanogenium sp. S4BF]|uniref:hypothetical protein n=1 Tax=Methanogenium sp. S4BF TaxID=1789226 RepID=UPI002417C11D|nr:hypothetical protein [Methanogenium sp. S4BF]WFN34157.1 hypothetical protein L1S32_09960 [Methanogenium sp. S4BF]
MNKTANDDETQMVIRLMFSKKKSGVRVQRSLHRHPEQEVNGPGAEESGRAKNDAGDQKTHPENVWFCTEQPKELVVQ